MLDGPAISPHFKIRQSLVRDLIERVLANDYVRSTVPDARLLARLALTAPLQCVLILTVSNKAAPIRRKQGDKTVPDIKAFSHNDVSLIVWRYDQPIPNCLGFNVIRLENGVETPLPAWVGFAGASNPNWQPKTTREWPIQKFEWKDLMAKPGGTYKYRIVPRIGTPDTLQDGGPALTSNEVTLTPERGLGFRAYFNRGISRHNF